MAIEQTSDGQVRWVRQERDKNLVALIDDIAKADPAFDYLLPESVRNAASDDELKQYIDSIYSGTHSPISQPEAIMRFAREGMRVRAKEDLVVYTKAKKVAIARVDAQTRKVDVFVDNTLYQNIPFNELELRSTFFNGALCDHNLAELSLVSAADGGSRFVFERLSSGRYDIPNPGYRGVGDKVWTVDRKVRALQAPKDSTGLIVHMSADRSAAHVIWEAGPAVSQHFVREYRGDGGPRWEVNPQAIPCANLILDRPNTVNYKELKEKYFPLR